MKSDLDLLNDLKTLISQDSGNENKCRDGLLVLAKHFAASIDVEFEIAEHTMQVGRCDMLLVGKPPELQIASLSIYDKPMFVYEMKSPQKYLFEYNAACNRFLPTQDLIQAETQLLNYTYTMREAITFYQNKYGTRSIEPAGIIMGREKTLFKNTTSFKFPTTADEEHAKRMAYQSRNDIIYKKAGIKLFTWDTIISKLSQHVK